MTGGVAAGGAPARPDAAAPPPRAAPCRSDRAAGLVVAAALVIACPSASPARPPDAGHPLPRVAGPSFRRDIAPVLDLHCASAEGCHGDRPTDSVELDLRPAVSWHALVGRRSIIRDGGQLVAPGDAARSFLLAKLTGELRYGEGKPMPLDPQTGAPPARNPLDPAFVDGVLRPWIARGAPED